MSLASLKGDFKAWLIIVDSGLPAYVFYGLVRVLPFVCTIYNLWKI